jgi:hypothetical protein
MRFAVTHNGEMSDNQLRWYGKVLRWHGVDIGKMPRTPEPGTGRVWLYVWNTREEAQAFAKDLQKDSRDPGWKVIEVHTPVSEGPLGPILIQIVRRPDEWTFGVDNLSIVTIRSAFPKAVNSATFTIIDAETWSTYQQLKGGLDSLVREIAPNLTGLDLEELQAIGYSVVDDDSEQTLLTVPPKGALHHCNGGSPGGSLVGVSRASEGV